MLKLRDIVEAVIENHWKTIDEINSMSNEGSKEGFHTRYGIAIAALEKAVMKVNLMQKEIVAASTQALMHDASNEVNRIMRDLDLKCPFCSTVGCTSDHK